MDFSNATILCLGDIMLDRFAYCETERISPEAPVPVLLLKRTQSMLGGVGNVARNISALGGRAVLMGLLGHDQAGEEVRALMDGAACRCPCGQHQPANDLQDPLYRRPPAAGSGR